MRAPGGLSIEFLGAIESLASAIELREVGALRRRRPSAGRLRRQKIRAVAQLGRAPASGAGGPGFKSLQPDVPFFAIERPPDFSPLAALLFRIICRFPSLL